MKNLYRSFLLAIPLAFFLLFSTTQADAYLNITTNTTAPSISGTPMSLRCTNVTGTFYCYLLSDAQIIRLNGTFSNTGSCSITGATLGASIANTTHILQKGSNGILYDISAISGGSCSASLPFSMGMTGGGSGALYTGTSPYWTYWGANVIGTFPYTFVPNPIKYSINSTTIATGFVNENGVMIPNSSDNSTIYGVRLTTLDTKTFYKYESGVQTTTTGDPTTLWGIPCTSWCYMDMYKEGATTWLYLYNGRLYKLNFTEAEGVGVGSVITAVTPSGSQTENILPLVVSITTAKNGTIMYFLDGVNIGNTTITSAPILTAKTYSFSTPEVNNSFTHEWYAYFVDSNGNQWASNSLTFTWDINTFSYLYANPMNGIALIIGGWFSYKDLATSQLISAIILSIIIALGVIVVLVYVTKGRIKGTAVFTTFIAIFIVMILMFSLIGWFPTWIIILLMVIGALAFVKLSGVGG